MEDRTRTSSRLNFALVAATVAVLVAVPMARAGGTSGPVATKSASLAKQVKSLKQRVAALEGRQTGTTSNTPNTTARPIGPAGGDLTGTYPNPTIGPETVTGAKVAAETLSGAEVLDKSLNGSSEIAPNSISSDEVGFNSVGNSELKDVHAVVSAGLEFVNNSSGSIPISCPAFEQLIAGGYAWSRNAAGLTVTASAPATFGVSNTWVVSGRNASGSDATLYAWATCLSQ